MTTFYQGLEVEYKDHVGFVYFICEKYITICLGQSEHRSKNVCILVYSSQWENINLVKQSDK